MKIHVIGDSHVNVFRDFVHDPSFIPVSIGAYCANNLYRKGNLLEYIRVNVDKKVDHFILVFGEIDCRVHFYYQFRKRNDAESISELIDATMLNYDKVLSSLVDYSFAVYNVVPAGCWGKAGYGGYDTPIKTRIAIYKEFHDKLNKLCLERGYRCIDLWPYIFDESTGFSKREFCCDEVHLNQNAVPVIMKEVERVFKIPIGAVA